MLQIQKKRVAWIFKKKYRDKNVKLTSYIHSMERVISKRKECIILQTDKWNWGENKESINI